jgi:hypothetical protein
MDKKKWFLHVCIQFYEQNRFVIFEALKELYIFEKFMPKSSIILQ